MDTHQLTRELDALRRDFRQYRVEMALRVDKLERRLDAAEGELAERSGYAGSGQPRLSRRTAPASVPASSYGYGSTISGFGESRSHSYAPPPISTGLAPPPQYRTPAHPHTPYRHPQQPPQGAARPLKKVGSSENAGYLPYVMERIASEWEKKSDGDRSTCACGRPTFNIACFREHHFDWCYLHQRPVIHDPDSCGSSDRRECQPIRWEKHADWELIVKSSFDSGFLGTRKVKDLYQVLFPRDMYPEKYQNGWYVG